MSEFAFELALCAHLEQREAIVARQLGASVARGGGRVLDVVCVEPGPEFDERVALTGERIPDAAIESDVGPGRARYWKDVFDCHPERARRAVDRAIEIGFFERERRSGRDYVRQVTRYPNWYDRIVGIENKPDLGRPGDLEAQLRTDVSLGLVDEVILATESYVTRAHRNRIPEAVGIWRVRREEGGAVDDVEVIREPRPLPVGESGVEPVASRPGRTEIELVDAVEKDRARRRIAERAYGKGWRTFSFPECGACAADDSSGTPLPYCHWNDRIVDAERECGPDCPGYESGESPTADLRAERERRTQWRRDPSGKRRRQSGLDRFG